MGFVGKSGTETGLSSRISVYPAQFIIPPIRYIHSSITRSVDSEPITGHRSTETNSCKNPAYRPHISKKVCWTISDYPILILELTIFVYEIRIDSKFWTKFISYHKRETLAALEAD